MDDFKLENGMAFRLPAHSGVGVFRIYNIREEKLNLLEMKKLVLNLNEEGTYDDRSNVIEVKRALELIESGYWKQVKVK